MTWIAKDRVLGHETGESRMLFAFGPSTRIDPPEERMQRVLSALRTEIGAIRWGDQVHGKVISSIVAEGTSPMAGTISVGQCDALMTSKTGVGLAVWTADCVPVLFSAHGLIAAVHSGWRGAVADISGAVVRRFLTEYGVPARDIHAVLGPAISGPHYEVSPEVIDGLRAFGPHEKRWLEGRHVDLRSYLNGRLENLGLDPEKIESVGPCTFSAPELASYRRDGSEAGRQWSLIYRRC